MSETNGEAQGGAELGVAVYRGLPNVRMVVAPGNTVSPSGDDRAYGEGEEIEVDGPTAIALTTAGHATPLGTVEGTAPPTEDVAVEEEVAE